MEMVTLPTPMLVPTRRDTAKRVVEALRPVFRVFSLVYFSTPLPVSVVTVASTVPVAVPDVMEGRQEVLHLDTIGTMAVVYGRVVLHLLLFMYAEGSGAVLRLGDLPRVFTSLDVVNGRGGHGPLLLVRSTGRLRGLGNDPQIRVAHELVNGRGPQAVCGYPHGDRALLLATKRLVEYVVRAVLGARPLGGLLHPDSVLTLEAPQVLVLRERRSVLRDQDAHGGVGILGSGTSAQEARLYSLVAQGLQGVAPIGRVLPQHQHVRGTRGVRGH